MTFLQPASQQLSILSESCVYSCILVTEFQAWAYLCRLLIEFFIYVAWLLQVSIRAALRIPQRTIQIRTEHESLQIVGLDQKDRNNYISSSFLASPSSNFSFSSSSTLPSPSSSQLISTERIELWVLLGPSCEFLSSLPKSACLYLQHLSLCFQIQRKLIPSYIPRILRTNLERTQLQNTITITTVTKTIDSITNLIMKQLLTSFLTDSTLLLSKIPFAVFNLWGRICRLLTQIQKNGEEGMMVDMDSFTVYIRYSSYRPKVMYWSAACTKVRSLVQNCMEPSMTWQWTRTNWSDEESSCESVFCTRRGPVFLTKLSISFRVVLSKLNSLARLIWLEQFPYGRVILVRVQASQLETREVMQVASARLLCRQLRLTRRSMLLLKLWMVVLLVTNSKTDKAMAPRMRKPWSQTKQLRLPSGGDASMAVGCLTYCFGYKCFSLSPRIMFLVQNWIKVQASAQLLIIDSFFFSRYFCMVLLSWQSSFSIDIILPKQLALHLKIFINLFSRPSDLAIVTSFMSTLWLDSFRFEKVLEDFIIFFLLPIVCSFLNCSSLQSQSGSRSLTLSGITKMLLVALRWVWSFRSSSPSALRLSTMPVVELQMMKNQSLSLSHCSRKLTMLIPWARLGINLEIMLHQMMLPSEVMGKTLICRDQISEFFRSKMLSMNQSCTLWYILGISLLMLSFFRSLLLNPRNSFTFDDMLTILYFPKLQLCEEQFLVKLMTSRFQFCLNCILLTVSTFDNLLSLRPILYFSSHLSAPAGSFSTSFSRCMYRNRILTWL